MIGNNVKIQNNVSVYDAVAGRRRLLRAEHGLHQRLQPPRRRHPQGRIPPHLVRQGATLGANSTIVCGTTIGRYAFIGAGAVVNRDVPDFALMVGVPARQSGWMSRHGERLRFTGNEAVCPHTGDRYRLVDARCELIES